MRLSVRLATAGVALAASVVSTIVRADGTTPAAPVYATLAATRAKITLPAYTPDDKQLVADQAQIFLRDLYVNRERKIALHGPAVDPVPGVADVVANARTMSEETLHGTLEQLFTQQHDLHLNYFYPVPYSCFRTLQPFAVEQVTDAAGKTVVAVSALATVPGLATLSPDASRIAVGDVLVGFDGQDPLVTAKTLADVGGGSNVYAAVRRELEVLTYRSQLEHKLPSEDAVHLTFKNREGVTYDLDLPWLTKADQTCLAGANKDLERHRKVNVRNLGVDHFQREYEDFYQPHAGIRSAGAIIDSPEPSLHYGVLENEFGAFGYLRLDSFEPTKLSATDELQLVKELLGNELAQTDGMIIDVRSNGGGDISLAEDMAQLFTAANIAPEGFRLLNTSVNRNLYADVPDFEAAFRQALDVAQITGAEFTAPEQLTPTADANGLGQAYFKPVALFMNSSCFSSCDMFSATLQDHGVATIWGEDGSSGGGGANVVEQTYFLQVLPAGNTAPFVALPGGQGMRVAWRQTVRVGKSAGQLLEETGVLADKLAPRSTADLFSHDDEQIRLIAADLAHQSAAYQPWVKLANPGRQDLQIGTPLGFAATVSDTQAIETRLGGQSLGFQAISAPVSVPGVAVQLQLPAEANPTALGTYEFIGYESGNRAWRAIQDYRLVPAPTALADGATLGIDLSKGDLGPLTVFTSGAPAAQGWSSQNGKLKAGLGNQYPDNLHTEASLFLDLTHRTALTLAFDIDGKTEAGYDFFRTEIYVNGVKTDLLGAPVSGVIPVTHESIDLKPYLGKVVELRFTFDSDPGVNFVGVSISNLTLN